MKDIEASQGPARLPPHPRAHGEGRQKAGPWGATFLESGIRLLQAGGLHLKLGGTATLSSVISMLSDEEIMVFASNYFIISLDNVTLIKIMPAHLRPVKYTGL